VPSEKIQKNEDTHGQDSRGGHGKGGGGWGDPQLRTELRDAGA